MKKSEPKKIKKEDTKKEQTKEKPVKLENNKTETPIKENNTQTNDNQKTPKTIRPKKENKTIEESKPITEIQNKESEKMISQQKKETTHQNEVNKEPKIFSKNIKKPETDALELPNRIEALLFASGSPISNENIKKMVGAKNDEEIEKAIQKVSERYENINSSLMITRLSNGYKINVKEKYANYAKKVISETELPKSLIETLAVIAWQTPVLQSEVTKVRTNKAYEDIDQLLEMGFVTKEKFGRSFILKVTKKFYDYFDVEGGSEEVRKLFGKLRRVAEEKEKQKEVQQNLGELKVEVVDVDKKEEKPSLGGLEVYEEKNDAEETSVEEKEDSDFGKEKTKKDIFDDDKTIEEPKDDNPEKTKKPLDNIIDNYKEGPI